MSGVLLFPLVAIVSLHCSDIGTAPPASTDHKMYVYSNTSQKFYLVDYGTYNVVREIPLNVPSGISLSGMTLSTNRDHLLFRTSGPNNESPLGFAIYDIRKEEFRELFFTEFIHSGPVTFIAAEDKSAPGLIYAHLRDAGTYAIDLIEKRVVEIISDEHDFVLSKRFAHSPDGRWTLIHKIRSGAGGFHELQFYAKSSDLRDLQFTLSENGEDSISIYDLEFSKDGEKLFISYQLSDGRSRDIESYFGSYDLQRKQLYRSSLIFPWSLNPYYLAYSPKRDEIYTVGAYQEFHIIDTETYERENVITLIGKKTREVSLILISPDENLAYVSCPADNLVFAVDLEKREVIRSIELQQPYHIIIP